MSWSDQSDGSIPPHGGYQKLKTFQIACTHSGITERLYKKRLAARQTSDRSALSDSSATRSPACPRCGKPMRQRTARQGAHAVQTFRGCSAYPDCRGIIPIPAISPGPTSKPNTPSKKL